MFTNSNKSIPSESIYREPMVVSNGSTSCHMERPSVIMICRWYPVSGYMKMEQNYPNLIVHIKKLRRWEQEDIRIGKLYLLLNDGQQ